MTLEGCRSRPRPACQVGRERIESASAYLSASEPSQRVLVSVCRHEEGYVRCRCRLCRWVSVRPSSPDAAVRSPQTAIDIGVMCSQATRELVLKSSLVLPHVASLQLSRQPRSLVTTRVPSMRFCASPRTQWWVATHQRVCPPAFRMPLSSLTTIRGSLGPLMT